MYITYVYKILKNFDHHHKVYKHVALNKEGIISHGFFVKTSTFKHIKE